jgi:predicted Zn finger-like uncharacterized protein
MGESGASFSSGNDMDIEECKQKCPVCGTQYRVNPSNAGRKVRCGQCQNIFHFAPLPISAHVVDQTPTSIVEVGPNDVKITEFESPIQRRSALECPQCRSSSIQRLELAWAKGTSSSNTSALGGAVTFGDDIMPSIGMATISKTEQTGFAMIASPPVIPPNPHRLSRGNKIGLIVVGILFSWMTLVVSPFLYFHFKKGMKKAEAWDAEAERVHSIKMKVWRRKWICHRCGDIFVLEQL